MPETPKVITMSSTCYEVTALPGVEDKILPVPSSRKIGGGWQYIWPYGPDLMVDLWVRVVDIYVGSQGWEPGLERNKDRAAMLTWLNRYRDHVQTLDGSLL